MNIYDFLLQNTIYCIILLQLWIIISIILFIAALVFYIKTKKKGWLIAIIVALFGVYQIVPHYFEIKAAYSLNDNDVVKSYEKAIQTSILPMQKAMLNSCLAQYYGSKNLPLAIKYYEKTFKYTKNYESAMIWMTAPYCYYQHGDFDKAIEIAKGHNSSLLAEAYIMKKDYISALNSINEGLDKKPDNCYYLALRANIYLNINRKDEANKDYQNALQLCKYENQIQKIKTYYQNKSAIQDEWELKRKKFVENGGVL